MSSRHAKRWRWQRRVASHNSRERGGSRLDWAEHVSPSRNRAWQCPHATPSVGGGSDGLRRTTRESEVVHDLIGQSMFLRLEIARGNVLTPRQALEVAATGCVAQLERARWF